MFFVVFTQTRSTQHTEAAAATHNTLHARTHAKNKHARAAKHEHVTSTCKACVFLCVFVLTLHTLLLLHKNKQQNTQESLEGRYANRVISRAHSISRFFLFYFHLRVREFKRKFRNVLFRSFFGFFCVRFAFFLFVACCFQREREKQTNSLLRFANWGGILFLYSTLRKQTAKEESFSFRRECEERKSRAEKGKKANNF